MKCKEILGYMIKCLEHNQIEESSFNFTNSQQLKQL